MKNASLNKFCSVLTKRYPKYSHFFAEYLSGKNIESHNIALFSGTDFEKQVLKILMKIPYGKTMTYAQVAAAIGNPKAVRAVASAIAKNKLLIVIPCHRVIRSDGSIGNYRGGTKVKRLLLEFEKLNT